MIDYGTYRELVYRIIGSAMTVHSELGYGLLEAIYQESLKIELSLQNIACETEKKIDTYYKSFKLNKTYKMDVVVGDIVCELKVAGKILPEHRAQLCNYMRLTHKPVGLLINFGSCKLEGERWAYDKDTNECFLLDVQMHPIPDKVEIDFEADPTN